MNFFGELLHPNALLALLVIRPLVGGVVLLVGAGTSPLDARHSSRSGHG
jgi:hypothetical protein